jgi:hypothetical protein
MMASPEWYYEENLKGKTVEEIKSQIRSLKRTIRRLQKEVDNSESQGWQICPSPEVQLEMHRLYLQEAVKALMDAQEYLESEE